jgi:hypothetical protein
MADTVVQAVTKRQRAGVVPVESKLIGVDPTACISIGSIELQTHVGTRRNRDFADLDVLAQLPTHDANSGVIAQQLFDGVRPQIRVVAHQRSLYGVCRQRNDRIAEHVGGRVMAGKHEKPHIGHELVLGETIAVLLPRGQRGDEVIGGLAETIGCQLQNIGAKVRGGLVNAVDLRSAGFIDVADIVGGYGPWSSPESATVAV